MQADGGVESYDWILLGQLGAHNLISSERAGRANFGHTFALRCTKCFFIEWWRQGRGPLPKGYESPVHVSNL